MITAWLAKLWARIGTWVALVGAVIAAIFAAKLMGEHKGKQAMAGKVAQKYADDARAAQQATQAAVDTRAKVEAETAQLPDAPAQKIAGADPKTAAGKLRDEGWTRD